MSVVICAGVPDIVDYSGADMPERPLYPTTSTDIAKLLRLRGIDVRFEHEKAQRDLATHKAADVWLPILEVSSGLLIGISGNLLTDLIKDLLGDRADSSILHVKYRVIETDGQVREFSATGKGEVVMPAIDRFENSFKQESE